MRKSVLFAALVLALTIFVVPALAGQYTYYTIKGGKATVKVSAANELSRDYGITVNKTIGPLAIKRGGTVFHSKNSMIADFSAGSRVKVKYVMRAADGGKGEKVTVSIKRLGITVGAKKSYVIGTYKGEELRVFNIDGGKVKKARGKYAYTFASSKITFNSALTNILNEFGTPTGTKHASAKVDLGSISVKIK